MTNFPIQLDATCNGYQHIALLSGDNLLAKELNLTPAEDYSVPKDFYNYIALKLSDYLKDIYKQMLTHNKDSEVLQYSEAQLMQYKKLSKLNIPRHLVKPVIMVEPYNASILRQKEYIETGFSIDVEEKKMKVEDILNLNFKERLENLKIEEINTTIKHYKDPDNLDLILSEDDILVLTSSLKKIVYTEFGKIKDFKKYLSSIATICNKLKMAIP
jgi:hypothetical protein